MASTAEPRWLNADEQRTWRAFLVAAHHLEAALDRQLLRDAGMPHAHYGILVALVDSGGAARMGEVASFLDYSPSRLAHAVATLEKRGWVLRRACPEDRRGQIAEITPAGREALGAAAPGHVAEVRRLMFDVVPADEQRALHSAMSRVMAVLEAGGAAPLPADCDADPTT